MNNKKLFTHFLTIRTYQNLACDYRGFLFQCVINSDIDLQKQIMNSKSETEIKKINNNYLWTHEKEIKEFLPKFEREQRPERIIYFQQFKNKRGKNED